MIEQFVCLHVGGLTVVHLRPGFNRTVFKGDYETGDERQDSKISQI